MRPIRLPRDPDRRQRPRPARCRHGRCFRFQRLAGGAGETPHLVAHGNQEHGLASVLEDVYDALLVVLEVDGTPVCEQVKVRFVREHVGEPAAHLALQVAQNAAYLLKRESLTPQLGDNGDLDHLGAVGEPEAGADPVEEEAELVGAEGLCVQEPTMGAEDFAYYTHKVPGCFFRLGAGNIAKGITIGVHTPTFNIDEDAIEIGIAAMALFGATNGE